MATLGLVRLLNRKVLRISGPDCYPYLQGLLCNDLRYLYEPDRIPKRKHARNSPNALSSYMLNAQGRAICDLTIYRTPLTRDKCEFTPPGKATDPDELLIECDHKLASGLANTLYGYRVRRNITLSMEDNLKVWSLIPLFDTSQGTEDSRTLAEGGNKLIDIGSSLSNEIITGNMIIVNDPRLSSLGLRIIADSADFDHVKGNISPLLSNEIRQISVKDHTLIRFSLGVGEGQKDHPESNCLPLECNADYLGSVSFSKGCYLGQELTARIHYTGVVRKRLMPIVLNRKSDKDLPIMDNSDIIDETNKKKVGILRHTIGDRALALLRCDLAIDNKNLIHEATKTKLSTYVPYWWDIK